MPVLRAVLAFQSYLAEHATQPLTDIPPEHLGVIASLTQESDKVDTELAKQIRAMLLPEGSEATTEAGEKVDTLSLQTIQNSVQSIATRVNYGMDDGPDDTAAPPSLQLWRWEVNNLDLLPKENLEKLLTRRKEREQAKLETLNLIKTLPADKYQALFQSKKRSTKAAPPISEPDAPSESTPSAVPEAPSKAPESPKPATPVKKEKSEKTKLRESRRAERQAKEEKEEKDKQAQVRMFNSFFQQPAKLSPKKEQEASNKTDFERTFLPCELKNIADINKFYHHVSDNFMTEIEQQSRAPTDLLAEFQAKYSTSRTGTRRRGVHPPINVRDIMKAVTESDVLGGNAEERAKHGLEELNNRKLIPIKLLQFQSDRRPGWVGTWTRSSTFITPRKPLGQDPLAIDYSYDSDAGWEDFEEGENVDAMDEKDDDESIAGSEEDSEMDDWLEDDLEEEEDPMMTDDSVAELEAPDLAASRNAVVSQSTSTVNTLKPKKKLKLLGRRFDSKLVPYITGPHWETTFSEPSHESFEPYQIHMLNDAHVGLNPFTFVSAAVVIETEEKPNETAKAKPASDTATPSTTSTTPARPTKFQFPDTHLAELLKLIDGSTRSKPALIEDLREHFAPLIKGVSKTAIESRLQECATKESKKPGAKWIIKDDWKAKKAE
ncbi:CAF-1 complex protein [Malassezia pachydermatis]